MTSLSDLARKAGGVVEDDNGSVPYFWQFSQQQLKDFAALHRASIIAELCADAEPVGESFVDGNGKHVGSFARERGFMRPCPEDAATGCTIQPIYSAETVAALQARVAELEEALRSKK